MESGCYENVIVNYLKAENEKEKINMYVNEHGFKCHIKCSDIIDCTVEYNYLQKLNH